MINLNFNISKHDWTLLSEDIIRSLTQAIIVHFLTFAIDKQDKQLFSEKTLKHFIYIVISMVIFNLIIRKIFIPNIKNNKN